MADYISRYAVEQMLRGVINGLSFEQKAALEREDINSLLKIKGAKDILNTINDYLYAIPTVDAQSVKYGKWIIADDVEHFIAVCSECGRTEDSRDIKNMPYCHCGARMK